MSRLARRPVDLGAADFAAHLPRLAPGTLSADGRRLLITRMLPDPDGTATESTLWEIDTDPDGLARQLPSPAHLEAPAYFGSGVVGISTDATTDPQLCRLQPDGTVHPLTDLPGGCSLLTAGPAPVAVVMTRPQPRSAGARTRLGVKAEWHDTFPARSLGQTFQPVPPRVLVVCEGSGALRDVTPPFGAQAFGMQAAAAPAVLSPDGQILALAWAVPDGWASRTVTLLVDTATGDCRTGVDRPGRDVVPSRFSADGHLLVCTSNAPVNPDHPEGPQVHTLDVSSGATQDLCGTVSPFVWEAVPTADGSAVLLLSDEDGRSVVHRLELTTGECHRLPAQPPARLMMPAPTPDGAALIGWASGVAEPPHPVRVDLPDGGLTPLQAPTAEVTHPGWWEEQWATAPGGRGRVHGLLALPVPEDPDATVPLLVFLHGGPGGAWGVWSAGWNPWPAVARGYAVLLANIAPSTGYGPAGMSRAWPMRGQESLQDLLALLDQLHTDHPRIAADQVGLLGCSHGGFLVNWCAGTSDRFRAAVSLAGIWDLPSMQQTTDLVDPLTHPDDLATGSPRHHVDQIGIPMLVVHGQQDHRIPLTQALWQWRDLLAAHERRAPGTPPAHRLLIFPDEHHGVTRPHNLTCWWQAVLAFADTHVRGLPWQWPDTLDPRPAPKETSHA